MSSNDLCGNHQYPCCDLDFKRLSPTCEYCISYAEEQVTKLKMNFEKNRLQSFVHWPLSWLSPRELARCGFYYTGDGVRVKCNYCNVCIENWEVSDKPLREHRRLSPLCNMLADKSVINIKIIPDRLAKEIRKYYFYQ